MRIREAAERSGLNPKRVRYYERVGLIEPARRLANGYRDYDDRAVHELRFIHRAREMGFGMERIRRLLALWRDRSRPSSEVKSVAEAQLRELDAKIRRLTELRENLAHLARCCQGNDRPDCPILEELSRSELADVEREMEEADRGRG